MKSEQPLVLRDVSRLVELARPLEKEANIFRIYNVFDDGGYRTLLLLEMLSLHKAAEGRLGDDARDGEGRTYELKTINLVSTSGEEKMAYPGVTTEHTLTRDNVARYRNTHAWVIGVFKGNQPLDVYVMPSAELEPYFKEWEAKLDAKEQAAQAATQSAAATTKKKEKVALNNPKIPFVFVLQKARHAVVPGTEGMGRPKPPSRGGAPPVGG